MRILCVSSQVTYGPVGNSATVPALQARGHEVLAIPTILLSQHPGHGNPAGFHTTPRDLSNMLEALDELGTLEGCGAVMTGYFVSAEQIEVMETILIRMKARQPGLYVLIDPVIGDAGALYVPETVAEAIRDRLIPLATCITPNRFELEWFSGMTVSDEDSAMAAATSFGVPEVLATSIPAGDDQLATLLIAGDVRDRLLVKHLDHVPHGTGDLLSGLYLAGRVDKPKEEAFHQAMGTLTRAIVMSAGTMVLNVAGALHGNARPS